MKKALAVVAFLAVPALAFAKDATVAMKYTGWHCAACGKKVETAMKKVDGVNKATVTKDTITVSYDDSKTDETKIKAALPDGFKLADAK